MREGKPQGVNKAVSWLYDAVRGRNPTISLSMIQPCVVPRGRHSLLRWYQTNEPRVLALIAFIISWELNALTRQSFCIPDNALQIYKSEFGNYFYSCKRVSWYEV